MVALPGPLRPSDNENDPHWENGVLVIPIAKARASESAITESSMKSET